MMKINTSKWGEFIVGDYFDVIRGPSLKLGELIDGNTPVITSREFNNGVGKFADIEPSVKSGSITVSLNGAGCGFITIQEQDFTLNGDAAYFKEKLELSIDSKWFIVSVIKKHSMQYDWSDKLTPDLLMGTVIKLPQANDKTPNWDYMDCFIKKQKKLVYNKFENIFSVSDEEKKFDVSGWGEYEIENVFPTIIRPVARSVSKYIPGNVPFVSSGNYNNAVDSYCEPISDEELDKGNCISVSPVDGSTFYQPVDFLGRGGAGSSIMLLYNDKLNEYNGLFISAVIRSYLSKRYAYGDMGNSTTVKKELIKLPQTDKCEIDWGYMEEIIKGYLKTSNDNLETLQKIIEK